MYGTYQKSVGFFSAAPQSAREEGQLAVEVGTGDKLYFPVYHPITVVGFGLQAYSTHDVNYDSATPTEAVWALDYQPTRGSATGRAELETITIDSNLALVAFHKGETILNKMADQKGGYDCDPGGQLIIEVKTQGAGGTPTGDFTPFILYHDRGEYIDNLDNTVTVVEE